MDNQERPRRRRRTPLPSGKRPMIGARISKEAHAKVLAICAERDLTQAEWLDELVSRELGIPA